MKTNGPVFAFTVHRSGSTLLGRLLNSHPELVVWGEHSGIINKLAEIDHAIKHNLSLQPAMSEEWLRKFVADPDFRASTFEPWTTPPQLATTRAQAKKMILDLFAAHLREGQRWGCKEIRYHRPYVAQYLVSLFPNAKFILLQRDIVDASVSNILSEWAQEAVNEDVTEDVARQIIRDVVYALLAFSAGFKEIATLMPLRCFNLDYSALREKDVVVVKNMFDFFGLDQAPGLAERIERVMAKKFNQTKKRPKVHGILTSDFIRGRATAMLPALRAEMEAAGVDRARLAATTGLGKYSYLVGMRRSSYLRF